MKKSMFLILIGGFILVTTNAAHAYDAHAGKSPLLAQVRAEGPLPPKLSDEQLEKMHAIKEKYGESQAHKLVELQKLRGQLLDATSQVNLNKSDILALQSKLSAAENELAGERLLMLIELHDLLSVEQRQQMRRFALEHDLPGVGRGQAMFPAPSQPPCFPAGPLPGGPLGPMMMPPPPGFGMGAPGSPVGPKGLPGFSPGEFESIHPSSPS